MHFTRRSLLKLSGLATGLMLSAPYLERAGVAHADDVFTPTHKIQKPPTPLGRIAIWGVEVFRQPNTQSRLLRTAGRDDLINLYEQVLGEAVLPNNAVWFKTDGGYCYSSYVQPVTNTMNVPEPDLAAKAFWAEVSMPFTDSFFAPDTTSEKGMRLYYSSVFRVIAAQKDEVGRWWYRLQEGVSVGPGPYVRAIDMRRIRPAELTPLATKAKTKRIDIDLTQQLLTAFEDDKAVMTTIIASGIGQFFTPKGKHFVIFKTPTTRMSGGVGADFYDLPGVPFPTYFTERGAAVHGVYWHNDFGRPRSHGCVNVPQAAAKWVFRWTQPVPVYANDKAYGIPGQSTAVNVF